MRTHWAALALICMVVMRPSASHACIACNQYNWLGRSVRSSSSVMIGKVIGFVSHNEARVEVLHSLRGTYAPKQIVVLITSTLELKEGETYIFSNPEEGPPNYPMLTLDYLDEVTFLLGFGTDRLWSRETNAMPKPGKSVVRDLDQAIRLAQGISYESREYAANYIAHLSEHPAQVIIETLRRERAKPEARLHNVVSLVDVLMLTATPEVDQFVLGEVRELLKVERIPIDWQHIPETPSLDSEYLRVLIGCSSPEFRPLWLGTRESPKRQPNRLLREKEREILLAAFGTLDPASMANATYAAISTRTATAQELLSCGPKPTADAVALGLFYLGRRAASVWQRDDAKWAYQRALVLTENPDLKAVVQAASSSLERAPSANAGRKGIKPERFDEVELIPDAASHLVKSGLGAAGIAFVALVILRTWPRTRTRRAAPTS